MTGSTGFRYTLLRGTTPTSESDFQVPLTNNIVRLVTEHHPDNPLIVQGPGAGSEVTAGGIFGDLLRLTTNRGARI